MSTAARFYFADTTGRELADHELNGSVATSCGPSILVDGTYRHGYRHTISTGAGRTARAITVADFGGQVVKVKFWAPNPEVRETFYLVPEGFTPA